MEHQRFDRVKTSPVTATPGQVLDLEAVIRDIVARSSPMLLLPAAPTPRCKPVRARTVASRKRRCTAKSATGTSGSGAALDAAAPSTS